MNSSQSSRSEHSCRSFKYYHHEATPCRKDRNSQSVLTAARKAL